MERRTLSAGWASAGVAGVLLIGIVVSASLGWLRVEIGGAEMGRLIERPNREEVVATDAVISAAPMEPALDDLASPEIALASYSRASESEALPSAIDVDGNRYTPGEAAGCRAVVTVFLSTDCPISNSYLPELNRLAAHWWGRGVELYGIVSGKVLDREAVRKHRAEYAIKFPVLLDAAGEWQARLQPTHVPQAFLIDRGGAVLYSGRIDDRYAGLGKKTVRPGRAHLELAVEAGLGGRTIDVPRTEPIGCVVEARVPAPRGGEVTYGRKIAPILARQCAGCHRPNAVAPFPLLTYEDAARHARQIALVARSGVMPPWKPVAGFGEFRDERRLSEAEIALLESWAEGGAPRGEFVAEVTSAEGTSGGWQLGMPDLVLQLPEPFDVPAESRDIYQYFVIPAGLTEDRWIKAIEFRPTNPRVVHHASLSYDLSGRGREFDAADPSPGYAQFGGPGFVPDGTLGGWGPGMNAHPLPPGTARLLPAEADLVVQVHYHPTGKPERDQSMLGIYFAREPVERRVGEVLVANLDLQIPAGEEYHEHHASYTLPVDATLHAVTPHMHLLGREIEATAVTPDGASIPLVRIDDWDFDWHDQYVYARPVRLPRGTRIDVSAVYDNSASNPFNPNSPPEFVRWGERTVDEMGICCFDVTVDDPENLQRLLDDNRRYRVEQVLAHPWVLSPPQ